MDAVGVIAVDFVASGSVAVEPFELMAPLHPFCFAQVL